MDPVCVMIGGLGSAPNAEVAQPKFLGLSVGTWIWIGIGIGLVAIFKFKRS